MFHPPLITLVALCWSSYALASTDNFPSSLQGHKLTYVQRPPRPLLFFLLFCLSFLYKLFPLSPSCSFFSQTVFQSTYSTFEILHGVTLPQMKAFLFPWLNFQMLLSVHFSNMWRSCCIVGLLSRVSDALLQLVSICKCPQGMLHLFQKSN